MNAVDNRNDVALVKTLGVLVQRGHVRVLLVLLPADRGRRHLIENDDNISLEKGKRKTTHVLDLVELREHLERLGAYTDDAPQLAAHLHQVEQAIAGQGVQTTRNLRRRAEVADGEGMMLNYSILVV